MNDLDIETRLREQLPRLADQVVVPEGPSPQLATPETIELRPSRRHKAVAAIAVAAVILAAMVVVAVTSGSNDEASHVGVEPNAPIVNTLTVVAYNFHFDHAEYRVPPGMNLIRFVSAEGSHTLAFADPRFAYVDLVGASGAPPTGTGSIDPEHTQARVLLEAGHTYTIFCALPGHRAAGMEARIIVDP